MATRTHKLYATLDARLQGPCKDSRRIANNTYLVRPTRDSIAVLFHSTNVVTVLRNGTTILRAGGWYSVTTKERISAFLSEYRALVGNGQGYSLWSNRGNWQLSQRDALLMPAPRKVRVYRVRYEGCYALSPVTGTVVREVRGNPHWSEWCADLQVQFPGYDWQRAADLRRNGYGYRAYRYVKSYRPSSHTFLRTETVQDEPGNASHVWPFYNGIGIGPRGRVTREKPTRFRKYRERTIGQCNPRARGPFFKVVTPDMQAPYRDGYTWHADRWQSVKGPLVACANGLHCATSEQMARWIDGTWPNRKPHGVPALKSRVFVAHTRGPVYDAGGKCVTRSLKLGRELDAGEVFARCHLTIPAD